MDHFLLQMASRKQFYDNYFLVSKQSFYTSNGKKKHMYRSEDKIWSSKKIYGMYIKHG